MESWLQWWGLRELRKFIEFKQNEYGLLIRNLSPEHITLMEDFSQKIYSTLADNEQTYIHHHKRDYYEKSFQKWDQYLWIFDKNKLIWMSNIILCNDKESFDAEVPCSSCNFFENNPQTKIAVFWSDSVLPEYRGQGLNKQMVQWGITLAKEIWCTLAASIVDRHNIKNFSPYFKNGFHMYGTGIDPEDGGAIALMYRRITEQSLGTQSVQVVNYLDFSKIDNLLQQWYQGIYYNTQSGFITFVKDPD